MNDRCPRSLFKYFGHPLWPEERPVENPAYLPQIEPEWIKSITVGLRALVETKAEVNKLVRRSVLTHIHPQRYRIVMHAKTFRLVREGVEHF